MTLIGPQRRLARAGWSRRRLRLYRREKLADETLRRPVDHSDGSPARHTRNNSSAVAWWCGANIAPTRHHDVETVVRKRQRLRVGLHPFHLDPTFRGDAPPGVEELGRQGAGGDDRARGRGPDSRIARPPG